MKLNEFRIIPVVTIPIIPVWILSQPSIDLCLFKSRQGKGQYMLEAEVIVEYISSKYEHFIQVFTDASKDPQSGQVGVAYVIPRLKVVGGEE